MNSKEENAPAHRHECNKTSTGTPDVISKKQTPGPARRDFNENTQGPPGVISIKKAAGPPRRDFNICDSVNNTGAQHNA